MTSTGASWACSTVPSTYLENEKKALIASLGVTLPTTPPPVKSKKVVKVVVPDVPVTEVPVPMMEPPPPYEVTVPGAASSLAQAQAQVDQQAELKKLALAQAHEAKTLALKKKHVAYNTAQSMDSDAISALAAVVNQKIDAATIVPKQEARLAELESVLKPLSQSRRIAQVLLKQLAELDLSPFASVLGWDTATLERQKIVTLEQSRRLRAALDQLRELPNVRRQLAEVVQAIDAFQSTPLRVHALRMEARTLAQVVAWSTSWPYNLTKSITDLRHVLGEMAKSQLKSDPSTIILDKGHAAFTGMSEPKSYVQDKAEV